MYCKMAVTDPRDGRRVALKKLPNVFQSLVSSKRVFRELKMLCFFKHDNGGRDPIQLEIDSGGPDRYRGCEPKITYSALEKERAVTDPRDGRRVALKKLPNVFQSLVSSKRVFRELKMLCFFKHDNVLSALDILQPPHLDFFQEIYVITELLQSDLHKIIVSPQHLTSDHIKVFLYQILRGLKYLHSARILHRDIKPGNLLVNSNCILKICDFGLARVEEPDPNKAMTQEVVTQYYRAPEILMGARHYSAAVDVWSVGCIFAELLGRRILFQAQSPVQQLGLITDLLDQPMVTLRLGFPFRFGYSTVQQIHCVVNIISSTLEEKSHCSAAFDRVWQTGLLYKLKQLLPQHHYLLLKAYLSDRFFRVKCDSFVIDQPMVTLRLGPKLKPNAIKEGDDVYFECKVRANPKEHKITWYHNVSQSFYLHITMLDSFSVSKDAHPIVCPSLDNGHSMGHTQYLTFKMLDEQRTPECNPLKYLHKKYLPESSS
ncbi:serine/threonine-protein kinase NLK2-like [Diaphorina citri]|uniref:Serine/threonine-protein kinase NLK2-like n=1 Tax=Diaphorina citri TaxID=121845 RepID=A0A1S3D9T1_DIACI|nr:serine/threonine-protein kinase NLK2-like [Diaphorina citri]